MDCLLFFFFLNRLKDIYIGLDDTNRKMQLRLLQQLCKVLGLGRSSQNRLICKLFQILTTLTIFETTACLVNFKTCSVLTYKIFSKKSSNFKCVKSFTEISFCILTITCRATSRVTSKAIYLGYLQYHQIQNILQGSFIVWYIEIIEIYFYIYININTYTFNILI